MAAITDQLSQILNETNHSLRYDIWLWLHLNYNNAGLQFGEMNSLSMRPKMANFLSTRLHFVETIKTIRRGQLLPEKSFDWINEDKRQIEWLIIKVGRHGIYPNLLSLPGLHGKDALICAIDQWNIDITQKQLSLNELENEWNNHKKGDKHFQWFKDENQKCLLAWEWINKNLTNHIPCPPFEDYEDLMIFFDQSNLIPDQVKFYIEKIKRKWSQQKYREGLTGKSQYNFILSDKAIKNLDQLANTYDLSRAKILEILLQMESEKHLYISEKVKLSRSMN